MRSLGRQSPRCNDRVPLTGNFGDRQQMPRLVSISGVDPDNSDSIPSAGDSITIIFDRRTSRGRTARPPPPQENTKAYADFFLSFEPVTDADGRPMAARWAPEYGRLIIGG